MRSQLTLLLLACATVQASSPLPSSPLLTLPYARPLHHTLPTATNTSLHPRPSRWVRRRVGLGEDVRRRKQRKFKIKKVKKVVPNKKTAQKFIPPIGMKQEQKHMSAASYFSRNASLADALNTTMMMKNGARDRGSRFLSLFTVVRFYNVMAYSCPSTSSSSSSCSCLSCSRF